MFSDISGIRFLNVLSDFRPEVLVLFLSDQQHFCCWSDFVQNWWRVSSARVLSVMLWWYAISRFFMGNFQHFQSEPNNGLPIFSWSFGDIPENETCAVHPVFCCVGFAKLQKNPCILVQKSSKSVQKWWSYGPKCMLLWHPGHWVSGGGGTSGQFCCKAE